MSDYTFEDRQNMTALDSQVVDAEAEIPHLGIPSNVSDLVRDYMGSVIDARVKQLSGGATAEALTDGIRQQARALQSLFLGQGDKGAAITTPWNAPSHIGRHILRRFEQVNDVDENTAIEALFGQVFTDTLDTLRKYEDDEITESEMQSLMDAIVETNTAYLLGLPLDDEDD